MKLILIILATVFLLLSSLTEAQRLSERDSLVSFNATDIFEIQEDIAGTYTYRKLFFWDLFRAIKDTMKATTGDVTFSGVPLVSAIGTGKVTTVMLLDGTITAADISTGGVETTEILDSTILGDDIASQEVALNHLTTATINYINAAGGGTITNQPDDNSIENVTDTTLGVKQSWIDGQFEPGTAINSVMLWDGSKYDNTSLEANIWSSALQDDGWGLFYWKANFRTAYRKEGNMKILFIGDSYVDSYSTRFREMAQDIYGNGGSGYFSAEAQTQAVSGFPINVVLTNWTETSNATDAYILDGKYISNDNTTDVVKIWGSPFNEFRIFYKQESGAGSFTFKVGFSGTYSDTVATTGSTALNSFYKDYSSTFYETDDTIYVKATTGTVKLCGFSLTVNPTAAKPFVIDPLEVHSLSRGGTSVAYWIRKNAAAWNTLIDSLDPSLCVLTFLEEWNDDFYEDMDSLITIIKNSKSDVSIMIVSPNDISSNDKLETQRDTLKLLARDRDIEFFDFYTRFIDYTSGNNAGVYQDISHLNGLGGHHVAIELVRLLFIQTNRVSNLTADNLFLGVDGENLSIKKNSASTWLIERKNTGVAVGYIEMLSNGRVNSHSNDHILLYIDEDNNTTDRFFAVYKDGGTLLFQVTETDALFHNIPLNFGVTSTPSTEVSRGTIYAKDINSIAFMHNINEDGKESVIYIQAGSETFSSNDTLAVAFGTNETNTSYRIGVTGDIGETFWVTDKATSGFNVISSNATSTATIDWILTR